MVQTPLAGGGVPGTFPDGTWRRADHPPPPPARTLSLSPPAPQLASEPVVTLCGHLYCWPCLYRWLQVQNHCRTCPVCKAGVDRDKVVPIYGRGGNSEDPRCKTKDDDVVPSRPSGQRPAPVVRNPLMQPAAAVNPQQGLGIIPTLFGLQNAGGGSCAARFGACWWVRRGDTGGVGGEAVPRGGRSGLAPLPPLWGALV